ncbi:hypothetical protein ABDK10_02550 [Staphylococcus aureus]
MRYHLEVREIGFEREKPDFYKETDYPSALLEALEIFDTSQFSQYKIIIKKTGPEMIKYKDIYPTNYGFNISDKNGYEEIHEIKNFDESIKHIYDFENSTMPIVYREAKAKYNEFDKKVRNSMTKEMLKSEIFLSLGIQELLNISYDEFNSLSRYMHNNSDYIDVLEKLIHFYNMKDCELQKLLSYYFEKYKDLD